MEIKQHELSEQIFLFHARGYNEVDEMQSNKYAVVLKLKFKLKWRDMHGSLGLAFSCSANQLPAIPNGINKHMDLLVPFNIHLL